MKEPVRMLNDPSIAIKLMTVFNRLLGLRPFDDPKGEPRILLSLPYLAVLWSLIIVYLTFMVGYQSPNLNVQKYVRFFYLYPNVANWFCLTFLGYYHAKTFHEYKTRLLKVDESLCKLGASVKYRASFVSSMILIIAWLFEMTVAFGSRIDWFVSRAGVPIGLYVSFFCCYTTNFGIFVVSDFITCVRSVKSRYEKVNDLLEVFAADGFQTQEKVEFTPFTERASRTEEQWEYTEGKNWTIQIIKLLHLELCHVSNLLFKIFGVQVAIQIQLGVMSTTLTLYYMYVHIFRSHVEIIPTILKVTLIGTCIIDFVKLFLVSRACEHACREADKPLTIVHACHPSVIDREAKNVIRQFALQLRHCHQECTKRYFSRLNYSLISGCVSTITTYLIITIQMSESLELESSSTMVNNSLADADDGT